MQYQLFSTVIGVNNLVTNSSFIKIQNELCVMASMPGLLRLFAFSIKSAQFEFHFILLNFQSGNCGCNESLRMIMNRDCDKNSHIMVIPSMTSVMFKYIWERKDV